jgi:hypothetical protein
MVALDSSFAGSQRLNWMNYHASNRIADSGSIVRWTAPPRLAQRCSLVPNRPQWRSAVPGFYAF